MRKTFFVAIVNQILILKYDYWNNTVISETVVSGSTSFPGCRLQIKNISFIMINYSAGSPSHIFTLSHFLSKRLFI